MDDTRTIEALVTGGSGFLGRWLLAELTRQGRRTAVLLRDAAARGPELAAFVASLGGAPEALAILEGDVDRPDLGLSPADAARLAGVRDVYHLAARFSFGADPVTTRRTNVDGTLHVLDLAATLPLLRRLVLLGGYRMTKPEPSVQGLEAPFDAGAAARIYAKLGAYEASKLEAHRAFVRVATERGLPWSVVHPSGVIGDARTGRTTQVTGLGETVDQLHRGALPALVGTRRTFLPLVTVDHVAAVLASVPLDPATVGQELVVLDEGTPELPELLGRLGAHLDVPVPRALLPVGLVAALPRALTGIEPEALTFLREDRYDTAATEAHLARTGLARPPLAPALERWADHLVATRFGRTPDAEGTIRDGLYVEGDPDHADVLFLHGLPWNGGAWKPLLAHLGARETATVDLPGLGRSRGRLEALFDDLAWLARLLERRTRPIALVGMSLGAQIAVRFAAEHPTAVRAVVAVVPAFLQPTPPWYLRWPGLVARRLARAERARFVAEVVGDTALDADALAAVDDALVDLHHPRVARRVAEALAEAARADRRSKAAEALERCRVPVSIVVGSKDPLLVPRAGTVTVEGAGHHLHVTHPGALAALIDATLRKGRDATGPHVPSRTSSDRAR